MSAPQSGKLVLRLPKSLHTAAVKRARVEGISLNSLLLSIISCGLAPWCGDGNCEVCK